jgi:hypothetical protein
MIAVLRVELAEPVLGSDPPSILDFRVLRCLVPGRGFERRPGRDSLV